MSEGSGELQETYSAHRAELVEKVRSGVATKQLSYSPCSALPQLTALDDSLAEELLEKNMVRQSGRQKNQLRSLPFSTARL